MEYSNCAETAPHFLTNCRKDPQVAVSHSPQRPCFVKSSSALHNFPPIVGFAFNAIISK